MTGPKPMQRWQFQGAGGRFPKHTETPCWKGGPKPAYSPRVGMWVLLAMGVLALLMAIYCWKLLQAASVLAVVGIVLLSMAGCDAIRPRKVRAPRTR